MHSSSLVNEPRHEKICLCSMRTIKGQISLRIRKNCTEISSDWRTAQYMKYGMHTWISFLIIFCNTVQDFKTNEPRSQKKFSFLLPLKSCENADRAFCIVADDMTTVYLPGHFFAILNAFAALMNSSAASSTLLEPLKGKCEVFCHQTQPKRNMYYNDPRFSTTRVWANSVDPDQSDWGLHGLPFCLHLLDALLYGKANFRVITANFSVSECLGILWHLCSQKRKSLSCFSHQNGTENDHWWWWQLWTWLWPDLQGRKLN